MRLFYLKPCMSRSQTAWSRCISLAERSRSRFALTVVCRFLPFFSFGDVVDGRLWEAQALSAGFCVGAIVSVELSKKMFTSRAR
jgi:hypothetical protein